MVRESPKLTPEACRAGRAILRWTVAHLAETAGVSTGLVAKIEHGGPIQDETRRRIVASFRQAGIEITSAEGNALSWSARNGAGRNGR